MYVKDYQVKLEVDRSQVFSDTDPREYFNGGYVSVTTSILERDDSGDRYTIIIWGTKGSIGYEQHEHAYEYANGTISHWYKGDKVQW